MAPPSVNTSISQVPVSTTYTRGWAYRTCRPDEYLIKSGRGCRRELVLKNTFQWPWQRVTIVTLTPRNYSFTLHCISKDLVPFDLPVVFTIGPFSYDIDRDSFLRYISKMSAMTERELHDVVLGVIHGQTRLYAAGLTVLQIFNDRDSFKEHVQERIGKELLSFGLQVFNGNVAEMRDSEGNAYFSSLKQKAISGAVNDARVQVATAVKAGDIGENLNQAEAKMRLAEISATVTEQENVRSQQKARSNLELNLVRIECERQQQMQTVEAQMAPQRRQAELQTELNKLENDKRVEFLRATDLADTIVKAEATVKTAMAKAEAQKTLADANYYSELKAADASLYKQTKAAEGIKATMDAQAEGIQKLLAVADPELVKFYLSVEKGLFESLASKTAQAVQGLSPKINIWNTGAAGADGAVNGGPFSPLKNLFTSLPPMLDALQSQTDVKLPDWMPKSVPATAPTAVAGTR